jgi:hypothetical protein
MYFSYELLNTGYEPLHTASLPGTTMQSNDKSLLEQSLVGGVCTLNKLAGYIIELKGMYCNSIDYSVC